MPSALREGSPNVDVRMSFDTRVFNFSFFPSFARPSHFDPKRTWTGQEPRRLMDQHKTVESAVPKYAILVWFELLVPNW